MAKIKIFLAEERLVEGIASSGRKDAHGTILNPDGASWALPLPLLDNHQPEVKIGEVTELWLDGGKLRFRARVDSADHFESIQKGGKDRASVTFRKGRHETLPDGTVCYLSWTITEISVLPVGSNADAKIERAVRKQRSKVIDLVSPPAVKSPSVEPPAPLPAITADSEVQRIRGRVREIDKALKRIESDEYYRFRDLDFINAAGAAKSKLKAERRELVEREIGVKAGLVNPGAEAAEPVVKAAAKTQPEQDATWPVRNLSKPDYPAGLRALNPDDDRIHEAHAKFVDFCIDAAYRAAAEAGDKPMSPVAMVDYMSLHGELLAVANWNGLRMRELEARVAAIEEHATRFAGVHQRSQPYHKGSLVIHGGALWCALRNVEPGVVPDGSSPADWQLAVKAGAVG